MQETSPLRKKKRQRTYLELAKAALKLFKEHGYEQTTVEQIAENADYSVSTFFRYFGSKEDVAFYGIQHLFTTFGEEILHLPENTSPWDHIAERLIEACRQLSELTQDLGHDQIELWINEPALERRFRWLSTEWEKQIATAYARHTGVQPENDLKSQLVSRAVISAAHCGFHIHVSTGIELSSLVRQALEDLAIGLSTNRE